MVGLTALGCSARVIGDDEFGEFGEETGASESSSSSSSTDTQATLDGQPSTDDSWPSDDEPIDSSDSPPESTSDESTDSTDSTTGDPGNPGMSCTSDEECGPLQCYVVPFLGGQCGECNEDADCPDGGCTPPNPFDTLGSVCNLGEFGAGCESTAVCMPGLICGNALDLLGLIQINSCGTCALDSDCTPGQICAPLTNIGEFSGVNDCIDPGSLAQDAFCQLEGNGNQACASGLCSTVDIMGLAQIGACGECNTDLDCNSGNCVLGVFDLDSGTLTGSTCQ